MAWHPENEGNMIEIEKSKIRVRWKGRQGWWKGGSPFWQYGKSQSVGYMWTSLEGTDACACLPACLPLSYYVINAIHFEIEIRCLKGCRQETLNRFPHPQTGCWWEREMKPFSSWLDSFLTLLPSCRPHLFAQCYCCILFLYFKKSLPLWRGCSTWRDSHNHVIQRRGTFKVDLVPHE